MSASSTILPRALARTLRLRRTTSAPRSRAALLSSTRFASSAATSSSSSSSSSSSTGEASSASSSSGSPVDASSSTTTATPSSWKPVIQEGVLPAYDEAIKFLSSHSQKLREQIQELESSSTSTFAGLSEAEREALKESLHIASEINHPEVLAKFATSSPTNYDARNPTFRHLREKVWRSSGVLEKIMQRCQNMHIFPDVLPGITPTVDLQVAFGQGSGFDDHHDGADGAVGGDVLAGCFLHPQVTLQKPTVHITAFHTQPKTYTLLILDPDVPDEENQTFTTKLHALKSGIKISATDLNPIDLSSGMEVEYLPPHPQQGSPYHRYTTIVFEEGTDSTTPTQQLTNQDRDNFDLSTFIQSRNLTPVGIHFWREKWSEEAKEIVSTIYADILNQPEPNYSRPPRLDKIRKEIGDIGSKWF